MSQLVNPQHVLPEAIRGLFAPILADLEQVEVLLNRELRNDSPFVNELLQYGGKLGGKRLRPALLLLTARAIDDIQPAHLTLAAVIEMIHTATLVHDDVLDEAEVRRHLSTVNARWNNEASVLLGDYLFSHAFYLASTLQTTAACQRIGRSTNIVCEGELRQVGNRGNHSLTEDEYYKIIDGKTAELCACACYLGAKYVADGMGERWAQSLEQYGRSLGMAFQIADDLLDLLGNEQQTGKSLGTDLEKQKATLPLIHCYAQSNASQRRELSAVLNEPTSNTRNRLLAWLECTQSIDYAQGKARYFAAQARRQVSELPASPSKDILTELTDFVVARAV